MDGGRVPAEPLGDLTDRPAGFREAEEGASCVEVELAVGPGQGRLRGASPCKTWGFALRDRTHLRLRPPPSNGGYGQSGAEGAAGTNLPPVYLTGHPPCRVPDITTGD